MKRTIILMLILASLAAPSCKSTRSEITFAMQRDEAAVEWPVVAVHFDDGFNEMDLTLDGDGRTAGPFKTRQSGKIRISFIVLVDGTPSTTQGVIDLDLKSDWRWGVDFAVTTNNPFEVCFGCYGFESYDLDPELMYPAEKKLYVVWGGNYISDPLIY